MINIYLLYSSCNLLLILCFFYSKDPGYIQKSDHSGDQREAQVVYYFIFTILHR